METDFSKLFLFLVLSLTVFVLISDKRRPLAGAPLFGGQNVADSETSVSMVTRGAGWANVACNAPPLSLMMPIQGTQPAGGEV